MSRLKPDLRHYEANLPYYYQFVTNFNYHEFLSMNKYVLFALLTFTSSVCYAQSKPDEGVLVTINGADITQQEMSYFTSKLSNKKLPPARILQEMINLELLAQAAKEAGQLETTNVQMEIKRSTTAIVASHYLQNQLRNLEITEDDLQARYKQKYQGEGQSSEYSANHILVKTETEALDIIKQLDQGGDFAALAKELSTGPSGKNGGSLGWFGANDMVPPFSAATKMLKPGKYTDKPVKTQFGWHVILLNETRPVTPPSFDSVKQQLSSGIATETIGKIIQGLLDKADIKVH